MSLSSATDSGVLDSGVDVARPTQSCATTPGVSTSIDELIDVILGENTRQQFARPFGECGY